MSIYCMFLPARAPRSVPSFQESAKSVQSADMCDAQIRPLPAKVNVGEAVSDIAALLYVSR